MKYRVIKKDSDLFGLELTAHGISPNNVYLETEDEYGGLVAFKKSDVVRIYEDESEDILQVANTYEVSYLYVPQNVFKVRMFDNLEDAVKLMLHIEREKHKDSWYKNTSCNFQKEYIDWILPF